MKALSIKQPWAWLIVNGHKPVENRDWHCNYRGPLLIHAGKRIDTEGLVWLANNWLRMPDPNPKIGDMIDAVKDGRSPLVTGGIVGWVRMIDCVKAHPSPFFFGPYGFVLEQPQPLPFTPYRGQLKIFDVPDKLVELLE